MRGQAAHNEDVAHIVEGIAPEEARRMVIDMAWPVEAHASERSVYVRVRD